MAMFMYALSWLIHCYIRKQKVILLNPVANTRELTGPDKWGENIFRTVETSDQGNYPMGKWMIGIHLTAMWP